MTGEELRSRRQALGLTQEQLAEYWHVTQAAISNWESETYRMRHPKIIEDALSYLEGRVEVERLVSDGP